MSLRVQWNDDDTLTIECGNEQVTVTPPVRVERRDEQRAEPKEPKAPPPERRPLPPPAPQPPEIHTIPLPPGHKHRVMIDMPLDVWSVRLPGLTIPWTGREEFARGLKGRRTNEVGVELPRGFSLDIGELQALCESAETTVDDPLRLVLLPRKV
ncbi:MAG TPA: hypothetical protein VFT98_12560 [Myxococcota bacterium]|nr:hypothetical protein [Myxococcota bacterium]